MTELQPAAQRPQEGSGPAGRSSSGRIRSLDGLRGFAALVVVVHHGMMSDPQLAAAYLNDTPGSSHGLAAWLIYSPLHLVWAGTEAVMVFFVLSGFVLAMPLTTGRPARWLAYYPRRLLRLYVPVWGSLLLSLVTVALVSAPCEP